MAAMWTSKLGNRFPREEIERCDAEHHRILDRLRREPRNASCAECGDGGTCWASVNLGVFVCLRCADVHRALGTHVSKVKGCTGTYLWGPDEIAQMQRSGNAVAEATYGGACSAARPAAAASKEERVELCRKKYEQLEWAPRQSPSESSSVVASVRPSLAQAPPSTVHGTNQLLSSQARASSAKTASSAVAPAATATPGDIDWDAIFADFGEAASSASASSPRTGVRQQHEAPAASSPCSLPHLSSANLGDFLGQCLPGPEGPLAAEALHAPPMVPPVGSLDRASSDSVWSGFGTW
mmetsp:Transcript_108102/g.279555  ORF Transcript_108102/g.279555 Transcript_108102/m.279555 type:complete len:296 (-) Transcript_108102:133-1020(-)